MAENEAGVAEQGQAEAETENEELEQEEFQYAVRIEDVGPAARRVTVEISPERIAEKLEEQFKELRQKAAIPGFRVGHAPRKLIEKRFSNDVRDQVRSTLLNESYQQAVKKNDLQVIGEPSFADPESIKNLPEQGPLSYTFDVEVQPDIKLPDLTGLKVNRPRITITEANIDQAMANLREQQGALVPVEDRGVEPADYIVGDVHIKVDGNVVAHQHDAQLIARPGRIASIQIDDLDKQLTGAKSGETRTINTKIPDTYPTEDLRGKDVQVEIAVKDIKKLELAEITPAFLADLGFDTEQQLRDALREQMEEKIAYDIQQAMREQVNQFLLNNSVVQLPVKLSSAQADRVVNRRALDLMQRGVPREQIEANVERLRAGAANEAARELKLFFILQKIAADQAVDVSEGELNGRIALLAAQSDRRPEKLKQEMMKNGSLTTLYISMREQKAVDKLLESAQIEDLVMTPQQGEAAAAPAASAEPQSAGEAEPAAPAEEPPAAAPPSAEGPEQKSE